MKNEIKKYLSLIGAKGGASGTGKAKARTTIQAKKAARARWDRKKSAKAASI